MIRRLTPLLVIALLIALVPASAVAQDAEDPTAALAASDVTCSLPESDADALQILNSFYPNQYWWDHTDITIAIQAHPDTTDGQLAAMERAIATWVSVIDECFDGVITLTDVTGDSTNAQSADITLHFVPSAGGSQWAGFAACGVQNCPNVLVRSDLPDGIYSFDLDDQNVEWTTLHEIGHALGLGHATNLYESTDLMGYGWPANGDPVLSQCDVDALAHIFSWAFEGTEPARPDGDPYVCGS